MDGGCGGGVGWGGVDGMQPTRVGGMPASPATPGGRNE